jgi:hypothetical protein
VKLPTHLLRCLKDPRTGWPAPYINAWTSEQEPVGLALGEFRGSPAFVQSSSRGVGHVDFKSQHMTRQRELMYRYECQVCRAPRCHTIVSALGLSGEAVEVEGRWYAAFTEPWLCRRCIDYAVTHCPRLIRATREQELHVWRPRAHQLILSAGIHDHMPGVAAVMWAKIAVPAEVLPSQIRLRIWHPH